MDEKIINPFIDSTLHVLKTMAAKAGVSNYIVKPFTPEIFEEILKKVLG